MQWIDSEELQQEKNYRKYKGVKKMEIYILQVLFKGVSEYPRIFDTEKQAKKAKIKMEKSSDGYFLEIYKVSLSLKMKSFEPV